MIKLFCSIMFYRVECSISGLRLTTVSREAKEKAATGALTDSRLTHMSILQDKSLENRKWHN